VIFPFSTRVTLRDSPGCYFLLSAPLFLFALSEEISPLIFRQGGDCRTRAPARLPSPCFSFVSFFVSRANQGVARISFISVPSEDSFFVTSSLRSSFGPVLRYEVRRKNPFILSVRGIPPSASPLGSHDVSSLYHRRPFSDDFVCSSRLRERPATPANSRLPWVSTLTPRHSSSVLRAVPDWGGRTLESTPSYWSVFPASCSLFIRVAVSCFPGEDYVHPRRQCPLPLLSEDTLRYCLPRSHFDRQSDDRGLLLPLYVGAFLRGGSFRFHRA